MSTDFTVTLHEQYVQVKLAPDYEIRAEGAKQLIVAIADVCSRQGLRRVLIEGTIGRRSMGTMDTFSLGSLIGSTMSGASIACCFYGFAPDGQTRFFMDVSQNRGARLEFFNDRAAALRWLGVGQDSAV